MGAEKYCEDQSVVKSPAKRSSQSRECQSVGLTPLEPLRYKYESSKQQHLQRRAGEIPGERRRSYLAQDTESSGHAVCSEKHPGQQHQMKCCQRAQQTGHSPREVGVGFGGFLTRGRQQLGVHNVVDTVQRSPDNKSPVCAMPKTAYEKNNENIRPRSKPTASIAAQGNIKVFPEPGREGNMPALPELLDIRGEIGKGKISGHVKPEDFGAADRDIGIAAEIAINLDGKIISGP